MNADQPRRAYRKDSLRKWALAGTNKLIIRSEALAEEKVSPSSINNLLSLDFDGDCLDESCNNNTMNQQQATNESLCAITNIIIKRRNPVLSSRYRAHCSQAMYKSTTTRQQVAQTTDRQRRPPDELKPFKQRALRRQRPAHSVGGRNTALITIGLLFVSTCSLIFAGSSEAFAFTEGSSAAAAANVGAQMLHELTGNNKQPSVASNGIERADKLASSDQPVAQSSPSSPPPSSGQSSVVASLSSAIASAAAAATVAAAQSALTGSDARSLLNGNHQGSHQGSALAQAGAAAGHQPHQQRSPGMHLALKLADAIPEVPYNILHNMKKLDHAAPFYNVANKMTGSGISKESSHGLSLANALASTSNAFGAEQLRALFQSPVWKRIADGYGEFTSEFRSLFRAPAHPMKGPTSTTTKLLRDLSVPAMLMLLASAIPNDVSIARSLSLLGTQNEQLPTPEPSHTN